MNNTVGYLHRIALIIILCTGGCLSARAQQNWFLFIQSESSQAFYVRIGETIYNSSPVGHLVINGLRDSTYRLAIGFPQSQYREHQFSIPVSKKDHGFELKKSDARSWILYDWQTAETINSPRTDSELYGERKKDNGFASLMAAVVNDSAVLYASIVKADPPAKKPVIDSAIVNKASAEKPVEIKSDSVSVDSAVVLQEKKIIDSAKAEPVVVKNMPRPDSVLKDTATRAVAAKDSTALAVSKPGEESPPVTRLNEQTNSKEKKLVFLDNSIGIKKDTITVIIPLEKDTVVEKNTVTKAVLKDTAADAMTETAVVTEQKSEPVKTMANQPLMDSIALLQKPDTTRSIAKKIDSLALQADSIKTARAVMKKPEVILQTDSALAETKTDTATALVLKEPEPVKTSGLVMINSDCSKFASVNDVDKLRVKMMNEKDAGNRIFIAHKAFKNMCFETRQIRALSELFPNDELRFRFFETAWPFVSDTVNFKMLEETLTDSFFITRFRTLLKRQ